LLIILVKKALLLTGILSFFLLAALLSTLLALFFYLPIKASLHMISISSLTVFIIGLSLHFQNPNTVLITVSPPEWICGFSRLEMKAHTNTELILGFVLGTTVAFTCSLVIKYRK
jgi:hypothetical protein